MSEREPRDIPVFLDETDDDWAWRRRIRANPTTRVAYRIAVFLLGLVLVVGGLLLVPLPGPGWLVVIGGLVVWASEFEKAQIVLDWVKAKVRAWTEWINAQPLWLRGLAGLVTLACVAGVLWAVLRVGGIPGFLPDRLDTWLRTNVWLADAP